MIKNILLFVLLVILITIALCLLVAIKQTIDDRMGNNYYFSHIYRKNRIEKVYNSFWPAYWRHSLYNLLDIFAIFFVL